MRRSGSIAALSTLALLAGAFPGTAAAARFSCHGEPASIVGTTGGDTIRGTSGRDVILARGGDDLIHAAGGDDVVCAGPGVDVLRGGPGDDLLDVGRAELTSDAPDLVTYDTARRGMRVDLDAGTATGQGHDRIVGSFLRVFGSEHHDVLLGATDRSNILAGLGGDDRVVGGNGFDNLYGDNARPTRVAGNDRLNGRGGEDVLVGGPGNDVVRGGSGPDSLREWDRSASGADHLLGGPGDDFVQDTLEPGTDQVFDGGPGSDSLEVTTSFGSRGHRVRPSGRILLDRGFTTYGRRPATGVPTSFETLFAPIGRWRLVGTAASERLWAPRRAVDPRHRGVTVLGRGGDDNIIGTEYDDVLDGGPGHDLVCDLGGADTVTNAEERARHPIDLCDRR